MLVMASMPGYPGPGNKTAGIIRMRFMLTQCATEGKPMLSGKYSIGENKHVGVTLPFTSGGECGMPALRALLLLALNLDRAVGTIRNIACHRESGPVPGG